MLVFTVVILLFSGLVYFSIVNFSRQRFYELLKIRATTIVQIEKSKEHLDIPENHVLNSLNDEELPMEKDYVFEVPKDSNYSHISKQIRIPDSFFKSIVKKGESNYNDKEFYYIGKSFTSNNKTFDLKAVFENMSSIIGKSYSIREKKVNYISFDVSLNKKHFYINLSYSPAHHYLGKNFPSSIDVMIF